MPIFYSKGKKEKMTVCVVTPSGNSGHDNDVPKAWIGKEAIVTLKDNKTKGKK
jgi:putative transposon-encoded protein